MPKKKQTAPKTTKNARRQPWGRVPANLSARVFTRNGFLERHAVVLAELYLRAPLLPDEIQRRTNVSRHGSRIRAMLEHFEDKGWAELTVDGWRPKKPLDALLAAHELSAVS